MAKERVSFGPNTSKQLLKLAKHRQGVKLPAHLEKFKEGLAEDDTITVFNATSATVPQYGILELDGSVQQESELELPPAAKSAVYNGITPTLWGSSDATCWNKRVVILQQELGAGEIGPAKISGISPVKVYSAKNQNPYQAHLSLTNPTTRLDSHYHNSGYGFPILWRERGIGEKWALVNLEHHDAPGFYFLNNPLTTVITENTVYSWSNTNGTSWRYENPGSTTYWWRSATSPAQRSYHNTAVPFLDQPGSGLKLQGNSTWIGQLSGRCLISLGVSYDYGKPYLPFSSVYPYKGWVRVQAVGDGVTCNGAWFTPTFRDIQHPVQSLGNAYINGGAVVENWQYSLTFCIHKTSQLVNEVTEPLRFQVMSGGWEITYTSQTASTPVAPSVLRFIQFTDSTLSLIEVNPGMNSVAASLTNGGGVLSGGVTSSASTSTIPTTTPNSPALTPQSAVTVVSGAKAIARASQSLKAKFVGGTGSAPVP